MRRDVSFVSVTQQFNTTSSMGRLTLNVLLSFAQFEREVTAERIRDKIAASKKKGMWMGGVVPLGYDVVDRKLVVNAAEAGTVRTLFDLYRRLGTIRAVQEAADRLELRTKARKPNNGSRPGGAPFRAGHLNKLLNNRIYIGEISHKGKSFPGEHAPIIDRAVWDAVQGQLAANAPPRSRSANDGSPALLTGLLFDEKGQRLSPHHCNKQGRRYHYYVSRDPGSRPGWRLPARTIETAVLDGIANFLNDGPRLLDTHGLSEVDAEDVQQILLTAAALRKELIKCPASEKRGILSDLVDRIELSKDRMRFTIRTDVLMQKSGVTGCHDGGTGSSSRTADLDLAIAFRRRGVEKKLILTGATSKPVEPDQALVNAVTSAHRWFAELASGEVRSVKELALRHDVDKGDVSRILPLAFLAPDIVDAILEGRQPIELTAYRLKRLRDIPALWDAQRRLLSFT